MEQRCVIHFLFLKNFKGKQIHVELMEVYGPNAYSYESVKYWVKQFKLGRTDVNDEDRTGRPQELAFVPLVDHIIEKDPYVSSRQIGKMLQITHNTVIKILTENLGREYRHLRWVPHCLNQLQKHNRVVKAKIILDILKEARESNFKGILTGDESWFVFTQTPTHQWIVRGEIPDEIEEPSRFQKKVMVTIFVTPDGKYFIDFLPKGQKYTADYFCQNIIPGLEDLAFPNGRKNERKWLLHFDNSPIHKAKLTIDNLDNSDFDLIPHPAYSPDIALMDFGLFGTIKEKMGVYQYDDENELKNAIIEILDSFGKDFFEKLFLTWEERLKICISTNGEYVQ